MIQAATLLLISVVGTLIIVILLFYFAQKVKKPIAWIMRIIAFILLILIALLFMGKLSIPIFTQIPTPTPKTQDETANWQTYKTVNDYFGYEFKYPSAPVGCTDECSVINPTFDFGFYMNEVSLSIYPSKGLSLSAFVDNWTRDLAIENKKDRIIGGENGIDVSYRFEYTNRYAEDVFVEKDGYIFKFNFSGGEFCCSPTESGGIYDADFFNAILSTFKFLD